MGPGMLLTKVKLEELVEALALLGKGLNTDFFRQRGTSPPPLGKKLFCLKNWRN